MKPTNLTVQFTCDMINPFKLQAIAIAFSLFILTGFSYAQDSVKKAKPVTVKPVVKYPSYPKPGAVAYQKPEAVKVFAKRDSLQPAAAENPALMNDKTLNGQYQYLLTKVYHYQQPLVSALWKNYSDTLNIARKKLREALTLASAQTKTIDTLKKEAGSKEEVLNASNARVDEISLLGIPMTKANYNWLMWGLVAILGAAAAFVIVRSGTYSSEAKYRIKLYNELEEEYKVYKAKANEKEKKLARELQTERNKNDELTGNG